MAIRWMIFLSSSEINVAFDSNKQYVSVPYYSEKKHNFKEAVYMLKNITLSAEEELINKAREKAQLERTTLNASFRQWLKVYANSNFSNNDYDSLMKSLHYVRVGKKFTRDEINER